MAAPNLGHVDDVGPVYFRGVSHKHSQVWMSHADTNYKASFPDLKQLQALADVEFAGYNIEGEETWGIQFHPEVYHFRQKGGGVAEKIL